MSKQRKYRTPEEKVAIVKEHLIGKVAVSELCEKHQIAPSQFYKWQSDLFANGAQSQDNPKKNKASQSRELRRIKELESKLNQVQSKLSQKNEVVAELMEEHLKLKKSLGEI